MCTGRAVLSFPRPYAGLPFDAGHHVSTAAGASDTTGSAGLRLEARRHAGDRPIAGVGPAVVVVKYPRGAPISRAIYWTPRSSNGGRAFRINIGRWVMEGVCVSMFTLKLHLVTSIANSESSIL